MFQTIFTLVIALNSMISLSDAISVSEDIEQVVTEGPELFSTKEDTAKLLTVFAWHESAFRTQAVGDGGRSIGVLQVNRGHLTAEEQKRVLTDRRFALQKGLELMVSLTKHCGSIRAGLSAYATGSCRLRPRLVPSRCREAGVRCE